MSGALRLVLAAALLGACGSNSGLSRRAAEHRSSVSKYGETVQPPAPVPVDPRCSMPATRAESSTVVRYQADAEHEVLQFDVLDLAWFAPSSTMYVVAAPKVDATRSKRAFTTWRDWRVTSWTLSPLESGVVQHLREPRERNPTHMTLAAHGAFLAVGAADHVEVLPIVGVPIAYDGSIELTQETGVGPRRFAWHPGAGVLATTTGTSGEVRLYDVLSTSRHVSLQMPSSFEVQQMALRADGAKLAVSVGARVHVFDVATQELTWSISVAAQIGPSTSLLEGPSSTTALAWGDEDTLLIGSPAGNLLVVDVGGDTVARTVRVHDHAIERILESPSGAFLATGATDGVVHVLRWPSLDLASTPGRPLPADTAPRASAFTWLHAPRGADVLAVGDRAALELHRMQDGAVLSVHLIAEAHSHVTHAVVTSNSGVFASAESLEPALTFHTSDGRPIAPASILHELRRPTLLEDFLNGCKLAE